MNICPWCEKPENDHDPRCISFSFGSSKEIAPSSIEPDASCCFKADILLRRALTVARGRLITITNKEYDETFNQIEEYLKARYPEGNWEYNARQPEGVTK